jgi:hypothetical protein
MPELTSAEAAPLLCAGTSGTELMPRASAIIASAYPSLPTTLFGNVGLRGGDLVAVSSR